MADPARARKLAVRIRQIVSAAIEMQIKDPRLGMVTVTDARVTSDLREATVFYTVYGDETQIADSAAALASAREGARYAVEPDPYRKPAEDDEDLVDIEGLGEGTNGAATADDSA